MANVPVLMRMLVAFSECSHADIGFKRVLGERAEGAPGAWEVGDGAGPGSVG